MPWAGPTVTYHPPHHQTAAPRLLQAGFAASSDLAVYKLARRLLGAQGAFMTLHLLLFNTWLLYTSCRTFSNTLEAQLISIALVSWPLSIAPESDDVIPVQLHTDNVDQNVLDTLNRSIISTRRLSFALLFAGLSIAVRPTAIIIWSFLGIKLLYDQLSAARKSSTTLGALESVFSLVVVVVCVPAVL